MNLSKSAALFLLDLLFGMTYFCKIDIEYHFLQLRNIYNFVLFFNLFDILRYTISVNINFEYVVISIVFMPLQYAVLQSSINMRITRYLTRQLLEVKDHKS